MIKIVKEIKKYINFSQPGSCTAFAYLFSKYLVYKKRDQKVFVVEGYVLKGEKELSHTWVVLENKIIDPTIAQFKIKKKKIKRIEEIRYTPVEYINLEDEFVFYKDVLTVSK